MALWKGLCNSERTFCGRGRVVLKYPCALAACKLERRFEKVRAHDSIVLQRFYKLVHGLAGIMDPR